MKLHTKNKFIYETHCHSREGSACSYSTASELVDAYAKNGYSGLILTDHFFNGNTAIPSNLPWKDRVLAFMEGYESALSAAKNHSTQFQVFFGFEYFYQGAEFLIYGLDKDFLLNNPTLLDWNITTFFDAVHEAGGFINHAHPFRQADYIPSVLLFPDKVDAVEVVNKSHTNPSYNKKALEYANTHNLIKMSGSDTHTIYKLTGGGMIFDRPMHSIKELIDSLKKRDCDYLR